MKKLFIILSVLAVLSSCYMGESALINPDGTTVETRFLVPDGYERKKAEDGHFVSFLRNYELKEHLSPVHLYNGKKAFFQNDHWAVFNLPIEQKDLQQCADSVIRVYAEYYYNTGREDRIKFHFTNGFLCEWQKWKEGYRVKIDGNNTEWQKLAGYDGSYENFKKYLETVFCYAGTMSMENYESETIDISKLNIGDVFLEGGSPGHVVMVVDACRRADGKKAFLLAQGLMPAQEFHIIKNPKRKNDPWYYEEDITFPFKTQNYVYDSGSTIKRLKY